jgi:hypothetical protein
MAVPRRYLSLPAGSASLITAIFRSPNSNPCLRGSLAIEEVHEKIGEWRTFKISMG